MKTTNIFAVLITGVLAMGTVGDFLSDSAAVKADANCTTNCDSKISLTETIFLLCIPVAIAVKAGFIPPPAKWAS